MKITARERAHIRNFIKLCYMLVIISAFYALKIFLYPEGHYELLIAPHQVGLILEHLFCSFIIVMLGNLLLERGI